MMRPERDIAAAKTATVLRRSVTQLARRLRGERGDHGLSAGTLAVLGHLARSQYLIASELAALQRVQPQSLTRLLAELEQSGLIHRQPDEADRRQARITITAAGRELLVRDARRQDAWLGTAIEASLTAEERDLLALAARLMDRLSGAAPPRGPEAPGEEPPRNGDRSGNYE
jgi:DNA-binding MarR family transcriptional regulator